MRKVDFSKHFDFERDGFDRLDLWVEAKLMPTYEEKYPELESTQDMYNKMIEPGFGEEAKPKQTRRLRKPNREYTRERREEARRHYLAIKAERAALKANLA